jgi:hypothetical protein
MQILLKQATILHKECKEAAKTENTNGQQMTPNNNSNTKKLKGTHTTTPPPQKQ